MSNDRVRSSQSGWMFIVWLLVWIAIIAIPTVLLAVWFPSHGPLILMVALVLFFAGPGFVHGLEWDRPEWTPETRRQPIGVLIGIASFAFSSEFYYAITEHRMFRVAVALVVVGAITAGTVVAFYIGRAIARRRGTSTNVRG